MKPSLPLQILLAFIAGALGVIIFHQGFLLLAYGLGWVPRPPYDMSATPPFDIPKVVSLAFWGGIWGIVMVLCLRRFAMGTRLWLAFLFGGIRDQRCLGVGHHDLLRGARPPPGLALAGDSRLLSCPPQNRRRARSGRLEST
jgi:hypothetical protein